MPNRHNKPPEEEIQALFTARGLTLSIAESCTGGAMAHRLTRIPGCSAYFLGSLIAYSNELKINMLEVSSEVIKLQGAVSEDVVRQMAKGMQKATNSDYTLAVTGIAGPTGGTSDKPLGTIWASLCEKDGKTIAWKLHLHGTREEIVQQCVNKLFIQLISSIKEKHG